MMLKCFAQGNPVPEVKWTSSSGLLENGQIKTDISNYMVISSIPFSDQNMYTCHAVNSLGRDQRTFPPDHPNCFGLLVATCFLSCLLLLGLVVFVIDVIKRSKYDLFANIVCAFLFLFCANSDVLCVLLFPPKKDKVCRESCNNSKN